MIRITEGAEQHLANIYKNEGKYPKLSISGGGCAGFQYDWSLVAENEIDDMSDEVVDLTGTKFILDGMSLMYLYGSTIDYKTGIAGSYLEVTSPAASSACGCGESVAFDMDMINDQMMDYDSDMFNDAGSN
jgi:iron-sulfur cluster insertion protein